MGDSRYYQSNRVKLLAQQSIVGGHWTSKSFAETPLDDFEAWYIQWLEDVPKWNAVTHVEYFGKEDNPLVMRSSNWEEGQFSLVSVSNSHANDYYKLLINPRYSARIASTLDAPDPIWSLKDFASRTDEHYVTLTARFGISPDFIYEHKRLFAKKRLSTDKSSFRGQAGKKLLTWKYDARLLKGDREAQEISFVLDESVGGMPIEMNILEKGGNKSRLEIDGWSESNGHWLFSKISAYLQLGEQEQEQLHSEKRWEFTDVSEPEPTKEACMLDFYGLPEPELESGINTYVIIGLAVSCLLAGYALMRGRSKLR